MVNKKKLFFKNSIFIKFTISIFFAIVWIDLLKYADHLYVIPSRFLIPFLLLIFCIQYKNHRAYFFVISIFIASMISNIGELPFYWQVYTSHLIKAELISAFSICGICEMKNNIRILFVAMTAIALMHNKLMVEQYKWNLRSFVIAIVNSGFIFWIFRYSNI